MGLFGRKDSQSNAQQTDVDVIREKAVIINAYSVRNAGDAAIMLASSKLLRRMGFKHVDVSSRHWENDAEFYRGFELGSIPPLVGFPTSSRFGNLGQAIGFVFGLSCALTVIAVHRLSSRLALLIAEIFGLAGLSTMLKSDHVVLAGGGYVYSSKRRFNLTLIHALIQVKLASAAGKRLIMMPQSLGPLTKRLDVAVTKWSMSKVKPVVVRDSASIGVTIEQLGRRNSEVSLVPDVVFFGLPDARAGLSELSSQPSGDVLIVTMDWTWARNTGRNSLDEYVSKLAALLDDLVDSGLRVTLAGNSRMPEQSQDDFAIARQVVQASRNKESDRVSILDNNTDLASLIEAMRQHRLVIGTRLHSCILALTLELPTLALAYQPKTIGTYQLLELSDYCFDVEKFTVSDLNEAVIRVITNYPNEEKRVISAVHKTTNRIEEFYLPADTASSLALVDEDRAVS